MSQALIDLVREKFPDAVISSASEKGDESVVVNRDRLAEVLAFLKHDPAADMKLMSDLVAIDLLTFQSEMTGGASLSSQEVTSYALQHKPQVEPRYRLAYNLYSVTNKKRLRVVVELRSDDVKVPTARQARGDRRCHVTATTNGARSAVSSPSATPYSRPDRHP